MRDPMEVFEDILGKFPRLYKTYLKYNFCKGEYADGSAKPDTKLFTLFYKIFYLDCSCCAAIRGLFIGGIFGFILGFIL